MTFVERGVGDVLLAWENEAFLSPCEFGTDKFDIVAPPLSILAEPPVAVVDKVADKKGHPRGGRCLSEAFWYTKEGQEIAASNSYRPRDPEVAKKYENPSPRSNLFTIDDVFGGWTKAQKEHFAEGGVFDQIYKVNFLPRGERLRMLRKWKKKFYHPLKSERRSPRGCHAFVVGAGLGISREGAGRRYRASASRWA